MSKRVLNVGQCVPDHMAMTRFLKSHYDVALEKADTERAALDSLKQQTYDLVLVNRQLDADSSDGLNIVRRIKSDADLRDVPVMLVSDRAESHAQATAAGAEQGFGKSQYHQPEVVERLRRFLG